MFALFLFVQPMSRNKGLTITKKSSRKYEFKNSCLEVFAYSSVSLHRVNIYNERSILRCYVSFLLFGFVSSKLYFTMSWIWCSGSPSSKVRVFQCSLFIWYPGLISSKRPRRKSALSGSHLRLTHKCSSRVKISANIFLFPL